MRSMGKARQVFNLDSKRVLLRYLRIHNLAVRLPLTNLKEAFRNVGFKESLEVALSARVDKLDVESIKKIWEEGAIIRSGESHIMLAEQWYSLSGLLEPINEEELCAKEPQLNDLINLLDLKAFPIYQLVKTNIIEQLKDRPKTKDELLKNLLQVVLMELPPAKRGVWNWPSTTQEALTIGEEILRILFPIAVQSSPICLEVKGGKVDYQYRLFNGRQANENIAKMYLKGYGPANCQDFATWANISFVQADRLWKELSPGEISEVNLEGQRGVMLTEDFDSLKGTEEVEEIRFIGYDDPLLAIPQRSLLVQGKKLQNYFFNSKGTSPGMVLNGSEVIAGWHLKIKRDSFSVKIEDVGLGLGRVATQEVEYEIEKLASSLGLKSEGFSVSS